MKKKLNLFLLLTFLLISLSAFQDIAPIPTDEMDGAWQTKRMHEGKLYHHRVLIVGPYFTFTEFGAEDGAFSYSKGGSWQQENGKMMVTYEFHTRDSSKVGEREQWTAELKNGELQLMTYDSQGTYQLIDDPLETALMGPYLFAGRKRNGEMSMRDTNQPRKTMKVLTGSHFQWIAYNTETKQFFGTGGGSYSAEEGKYVENIQFFSRDNSRVGASLGFDFEVKDGAWHHSGFSSKGDPMYEVWARRSK